MSQSKKFLSQKEKDERRFGSVAFWVINVLVLAVSSFLNFTLQLSPNILVFIPWFINFSFLGFTFWKKPQATIGYLIGAVSVIGLGLSLGVGLFISCLTGLVILGGIATILVKIGDVIGIDIQNLLDSSGVQFLYIAGLTLIVGGGIILGIMIGISIYKSVSSFIYNLFSGPEEKKGDGSSVSH